MADFDAFDRMTRDLRGQRTTPPRGPIPNMGEDLLRNGGSGGVPGIEVAERPFAAGDSRNFPGAPKTPAPPGAFDGEVRAANAVPKATPPAPLKGDPTQFKPLEIGQTGAKPAGPSALQRPGAAATLAGISMGSSTESFQRPTEDYRRRFGMDLKDPSFMGDVAARAGGVMTDLGATILDTPVGIVNGVSKMFGGKGDLSLPGGNFSDIVQRQDGAAPAVAKPQGPAVAALNGLPTTMTDVQRGGASTAPAVPNSVLRQGNSYSGPEGIGGDIAVNNRPGGGTVTMMGGQPGDLTSAQRMANDEVNHQHQMDMVGLRQRAMDVNQPGPGVSLMQHTGNGMMSARTPEQAARDASVSASSITNTDGLSTRQRRAFAIQDNQQALEQRRNDQNNDTLRRGQDVTGRGQDLNYGSTTRGQDLDFQGKVMQNRTAATRLRYDMNKDVRDFKAKERMDNSTLKSAAQTRAKYNVDNGKAAFEHQFYKDDGKGGRVRDTEAEAEAFRRAQLASGGKYAEADPATQADAMPQARAETNILRSANERRGTRVSDFFGTTPPAFSNMPTNKQLQSAKIGKVGFWDDTFTTGKRDQGDTSVTWMDDSGNEQTMYVDPTTMEQADVKRLLRNGAKQGK